MTTKLLPGQPQSRQIPLYKQVIALALFKLLVNTSRRFVYPFAPVLSRGLDVPLAAITTIIAAGQFTSIIGFFCGPFADRLGYRAMMGYGLGCLFAGMLLCGFFPFYWLVFLGLLVTSLGKTVFDPAVQAFIGQNVPFQRRGRVIGLVEMSWAGSTLIGIPFLGLVIDQAGLIFSFYLLSLLALISWFSLKRIIPAEVKHDTGRRDRAELFSSLKQLVRIRPAAGMLAFGFWISIANDSLFVIYGVWLEQNFHVTLLTLGFSTIAIGAAELCGESLTALFADRLGGKRATVLGLVLVVISYALLPLVGLTLPLALIGMFMVFVSFEFSMVCSFSLSTELMPGSRATMMAGFYATAGIGRMIGVLIGTFLWEMGGIAGVAWTASGLSALGLLSLLWGLHGWNPCEENGG
ncbi:MAG: MFS transporter [Deltaproteobacteria bacterium]|nr:MFS transporter [Deltaproteobacteria bacterium]